jgi:hypothetical protein
MKITLLGFLVVVGITVSLAYIVHQLRKKGGPEQGNSTGS